MSATEWLEDSSDPSWRSEDTVKLSHILVQHGVDLLDVSSGGNSPAQNIKKPSKGENPAYQARFSEAVKKDGANLLVGAVGDINTGTVAENVMKKGQADVIFVGRAFQKNPGLVWAWAEELGVEVQLPSQIRWGVFGRGKKAKKIQKL